MMSDKSNKFKVIISFAKDGGGEVFYKNDGERFDSKSTVKLNVDTKYVLKVTIRPPQTLERLLLLDELLQIEESTNDREKAQYTASWSVLGLKTTKRTKRDKIPLTLEVKDLGILKLTMQMKFYKEKDVEHATWGTALHQIELDCEAKNGLSFVDILKESYR